MDNIEICFIPCQINRGRKFRGFAYSLGDEHSYSVGYSGSGVFPKTTMTTAKLWDPDQKKVVYANADFLEDVEVDPSKVEADKKAYIDFQVNDTINWCKSQKPDAPQDEILRFAKNCMRKRHPEFVSIIENMLSKVDDTRDIAKEVFETLDWAVSLRTKPTYLYGKTCKGGREYPKSKVLSIAWKVFSRKGIIGHPDFKNAWILWSSLHQFPGEKFLAKRGL